MRAVDPLPGPPSALPRPQRLRLSVAPPFELGLGLFGHGWVDLSPHRIEEAPLRLVTVLPTAGGPADVTLAAATSGDLAVRVATPRRLTLGELAHVRRTLRWMLRLDDDLSPFWRRCEAEPRLAWVAARGGGRMLRSPGVFEDLMKLLFTTNCSWGATRLMAQRLVDALGAPAPSGRRAFPTAAACAEAGVRFFRQQVRVGYRDRACHGLAEAFASGRLDDAQFTDPALDAAELRRRLLSLPGFGPYAAGQALRLLGHHEDLALDSWCRAKLARTLGKRRPPSDAAIDRAYRRFGRWKGLALWMDLTADWHQGGRVPFSHAPSGTATREH